MANNIMQLISRFPQFMYQMRGQDPNAIIQNAVQSGKITPQQLEQIKQQAQQISGQMGQFKSMFGFK